MACFGSKTGTARMTPAEESAKIITNARNKFFVACEIDRDQLHDVYRLVSEAEVEREMSKQ